MEHTHAFFTPGEAKGWLPRRPLLADPHIKKKSCACVTLLADPHIKKKSCACVMLHHYITTHSLRIPCTGILQRLLFSRKRACPRDRGSDRPRKDQAPPHTAHQCAPRSTDTCSHSPGLRKTEMYNSRLNQFNQGMFTLILRSLHVYRTKTKDFLTSRH